MNQISIAIVVDATGSMASTLEALRPALTQLCKLLPLFANVKYHLVIYRDFDQHNDLLYKHHGPFNATDVDTMNKIIKQTVATGGGDTAECQKYAFNRLLNDIEDENLIVFHFTDAPPHSYPFPVNQNVPNHFKEGYTLKINGMIPEWIQLCKKYKERHVPVYTIGYLNQISYPYYAIIAELTGGDLILLNNTSVETILKCTTSVCARALGYNDCDLTGIGKLMRIIDPTKIPNSETDQEFKVATFIVDQQTDIVRKQVDVCNRSALENRYATDNNYRDLCFSTFTDILNSDQILDHRIN